MTTARQAVDLVESYRDVASGLMDLYLSLISQRMNEVMKVLTIIATLFIPLSFIAGLYGMNFDPGGLAVEHAGTRLALRLCLRLGFDAHRGGRHAGVFLEKRLVPLDGCPARHSGLHPVFHRRHSGGRGDTC